MKIVLLGGAGYFGRSIVNEYASRMSGDARFVIADYDYRSARKMAKKLGGRFSARMVDVADPNSYGKALEEAHLAVSFVGPWYRFGEAIIEGSLLSGKPLVTANTGYVNVSDKMMERFTSSRGRCVTGISIFPGAISLIVGFFLNRFPCPGSISFTLKIDTGRYGGLAFIREYFQHLSWGSDIPLPGECGKRARVTFKPSGLLQQLAVGGKGRFRIEMISAFQEMARKKPVPGVSGGVTLAVSSEAGRDSEIQYISARKLLTLLSGMLAGASAVALGQGKGSLITHDELAKNPLFMKHVEEDLQKLTEIP